MASITCTFTAATDTLLENYSVAGEATFTKNALFEGGSAKITDANRCRSDVGLSLYYANNFTPATNNYKARARLRRFTNTIGQLNGVGIRTATGAWVGYYALYVDSSASWALYIGGSGTPLATWPDVWTLGDERVVEIEATGGDTPTIAISINGTQRISFVPTGANIVTAAGVASIFLNVACENTTGAHLDDFSVADAGGNDNIVTVASTDLWYNKPIPTAQGVRGYTSPMQANAAELHLTTDHTTFIVHASTTIFDTLSTEAKVVVIIDGAAQSPSVFGANERTTFAFSGLSAGSKDIIVRGGLESAVTGGAVGTFINGFEVSGGTTYSITAPAESLMTLVYGDSISVGYNADISATHGWVGLLKDTYHLQVMHEGWGGRTMHDDAVDATARTNFATKLAGFGATNIWLAIGTNDYGLNKWTAADFGTAYADLLDKIHSADGAVHIFCQTPTPRTSEVVNALGSTLPDYRAQITTAVSTRTAYCTLVDGTAIIATSDLVDAVHPTTAGHAKYAAYVAPLLDTAAGGLSIGFVRKVRRLPR